MIGHRLSVRQELQRAFAGQVAGEHDVQRVLRAKARERELERRELRGQFTDEREGAGRWSRR